MITRTRIVLLMHPQEFRRKKCNTGRLTCLNLANSEFLCGLDFDSHPRVRELLDNPENIPLILYPGRYALDLSQSGFRQKLMDSLCEDGDTPETVAKKTLVVFLIDATWALAKQVIKQSPGLMSLRQVKFSPTTPSRYTIKRQPAAYCLSTLEATHEILCALEQAGLEDYPDKTRLYKVFDAMQNYQIEQASERRTPRFHQS